MDTINMFTKDEQVILKNVSSKYKWIARDSDGTLFLFNKKPAKYTRNYGVGSGFLYYFRLEPFEDIFKGVTWDGGPVQFRKDVLDETDLISRQAAIDAVNNLTYPSSLVDVKRILVDLPSAQPEIIRCKDCRHWQPHSQYGYDYDDDSYGDYCGLLIPEDDYYAFERKADDFCSRAERRTGETD